MELYYATSKNGNFGDDMNLWFWDYFLPDWRNSYPDRTLFGIGSILGAKVLDQMGKVLVCGSGSGYGSLGPVNPERIHLSWVRGPLTARLLGLEDAVAITDPASLLTIMPEFAELPRGGGGTIFIPHRSTAQLAINWDRIGRLCGLQVVLPNQDAKEVIHRIVGADLVVTESMHGAIIADAFRIPWAPIRISNQFNEHKWNDWAAGLGLAINAADSLTLPKKLWRLSGKVKSYVRPRGARATAAPAPTAPIPAIEAQPRQPSTGGFDLGRDGRQRVKKMISVIAPMLERIMAADIRRAMQHHVQLSAEGRTEVLIAQMVDRLATTGQMLRNSSWQ